MAENNCLFNLSDFSKFDYFTNDLVTPENKKEFVVLGERLFSLNKSKSKNVSVGLAYEYGYAPCIKLSGNRGDIIIFDENEWNHFLSYQGVITNYLYSNHKEESVNTSKFCIDFQQISYARIIKISKNNSAVYLGYESVCKLWELLPLIRYRIDFVKRQQFSNYFRVLQKGLENQSGNVFTNTLNALRPQDNPNSENLSTVMEFIYMYPDVFESECCKK